MPPWITRRSVEQAHHSKQCRDRQPVTLVTESIQKPESSSRDLSRNSGPLSSLNRGSQRNGGIFSVGQAFWPVPRTLGCRSSAGKPDRRQELSKHRVAS